MKYKFTKMEGTGNDFVVFDTFTQSFSFDRKQVRHIADRNFGIGCDQVLLLEPPQNEFSDARYRIFNADGNEVMQCGNGARCAAIYLKEKGIVDNRKITMETGAGQLILQIEPCGGVTVDMGVPEFEPTKIPMNTNQQKDMYSLILDGQEIEFGAVSMGNPHVVIFVDDVNAVPIHELGPAIQNSSLFPESVNVGFLEIINEHSFTLRVYERGSGETLACGSGACAAMVIACQQKYLKGTIDAKLRGGHLTLRWAGERESVYMTGPATIVFEGKIRL